MKKKLVFLVTIILVTSLTMVACSSSDDAKENNEPQTEQTTSTDNKTTKELEAAIAEQSILLTSVGQSADVEMVKVMLDKNGLTYTLNNLATAEDLGDNKTLLLAVGGSSKGLGAAGIDANEEIARVEALIRAAKEKGLTIISTHIGGESRRGELSDKFIYPTIPESDYIVIVEAGDKDGLMSNMAIENDIPVASVKSMADVIAKLKAAFK